MNLKHIDDNIFDLFSRNVIPIKAFHNKMPVYGFRFDNLTYLTDVNEIPESSIELIEGTSVLVVNALRKEEHPSHFNLEEALRLIKRINPERAYLTHIGHQMGLHDEVSAELPDNVELAYDGLSLNIVRG